MKGKEYSNHGIVWKKSELREAWNLLQSRNAAEQLRGHIVTSINNNYQP
jgi:hypothetical protein